MGAGRILHALTPPNPGTKRWELIYEPAAPFSMLVSYWFMRSKNGLDVLKNMRKLAGDSTLCVDCGIYSLKSEFGMVAQVKVTEQEIQAARKLAEDRFDEFREYVVAYGEFLRAGYDLYTYALDFDADTILSPELTDELRELLLEAAGEPATHKIAPVYHVGTRPDVNAWWTDICQDTRYDYVAIEGGQMHRGTPEFYIPLIAEAHQCGKKVHVLAISGVSFPRDIPADYMDASTHSMGGQKALIQTPWGTFSAGRRMVGSRHILAQPKEVQEATREFVKGYGFTLEQLMDSEEKPNVDAQYYRQQLSIYFMNDYWDVPYSPTSSMESLF